MCTKHRVHPEIGSVHADHTKHKPVTDTALFWRVAEWEDTYDEQHNSLTNEHHDRQTMGKMMWVTAT